MFKLNPVPLIWPGYTIFDWLKFVKDPKLAAFKFSELQSLCLQHYHEAKISLQSLANHVQQTGQVLETQTLHSCFVLRELPSLDLVMETGRYYRHSCDFPIWRRNMGYVVEVRCKRAIKEPNKSIRILCIYVGIKVWRNLLESRSVHLRYWY